MRFGYIMCGDKEVASFRGRVVTPILPDLVPLCFRNGGDLEYWLTHRAIDRHRTNSRILKRMLRITDTSDINTVLHVHGATLTDNYWVHYEDEPDLKWSDVAFSKDYFAEVALRGTIDTFGKGFTKEQLSSPTPELTNIGSYEKCWKLIDGRWVLYKTGNPLSNFSEVFTYILGMKLGFNMAEYALKGDYVVSPDFTSGKVNFEPAENLVYDNQDYSYNYDTLQRLKPGLEKEYLDILFMDALVLNVDRHTQNYGVLRDQETGEIIYMAPNFDNNMALISLGYAEDPASVINPLIDDFLDLLVEKGVQYRFPTLRAEDVESSAQSVGMDVDIQYIVKFVMSNYERMRRGFDR